MQEKPKKPYTIGEEIFNSTTHGVGTLLSVAALVLLIVFAIFSPAPLKSYRIASGIIYGCTLVLLYACSTLYHAFINQKVKGIFKIFDHCSIYLLIAGTYTPFALVTLNGVRGWIIFGVVWAIAVFGIVLDAISIKKPKWLSLFMYLFMSWLIITQIKPISEIGTTGVWLLMSGGAAYTLGAVFYALKKVKWTHSIWHIFVLAGSILHFFSILFFVVR